MTRNRTLLIISGTALILLIVAIAAFSLGVYVGTHGWTAGPPSVAGPAQRPAAPAGQANPAPQAAAQPAAPPGPQPQLVGRVRSRSGDTITLDTPQGPRLFQIGRDVQVARAVEGQAEVPASLQQVQPGRRLAVFGQFAGDGARLLIAQRLLLLPQVQP